MKKALVFMVLLTLLVPPGMGAVWAGTVQYEEPGGMPGRPLPDKPIPRHEPGYPSTAGGYTTQVTMPNADGIQETIALTGLDALLEDGVISDPLQGNYRLVGLDKILVGLNEYFPLNSLSIRTFSAISGTMGTAPEVITGSQMELSDPTGVHAVAAGDLNLDGVDEQIAAWIDADQTLNLGIGEMPGSLGRTTSDPAAVAHSDGSGDLLVRGFDQSLWHRHFDGSAWGEWDNAAGGLLISPPAIASQGDGSFDAFAIGADNLIYRRHWDGSAWTGDWELADDPAYWQTLNAMPSRSWPMPPDVDAPGAVARPGTTQTDLFRRGPDNHLHWRHYTGSAWEDWVDLGGIITSAPSAVSFGQDDVRVFARFMDGQIWVLSYDSGGWGKWRPLPKLAGVWANSSPTAVRQPGTNTISVYVRGSDGALYTIEHDGTNWGAWSNLLGGSLSSAVAAVAWTGARDLFAQEVDGSLQHNRFDGFTWTGWENWGGLKACCQVTDTGFGNVYASMLSMDTGYFSGDGRPQILVAFADNSDWHLRIQIYDIANGFQATLKAETDLAGFPFEGSRLFKIAAGNFDEDGTEEIVLLYKQEVYIFGNIYIVQVFDVTIDAEGNWGISQTGSYIKSILYDSNPDPWELYSVGITDLDLAVGNFDGDPADEVAVGTLLKVDWGFDFMGMWFHETYYYRTMQVLDDLDLENATEVYYERNLWGTQQNEDDPAPDCIGCLTLAAGNLDGNPENGDEIVNTVHVWDDTPRSMFVYRASPKAEPPWDLEKKAQLDFPEPSFGHEDGLVLGDFDRNLQDDIAFIYHHLAAPFLFLRLGILQYTEDDDDNTGLSLYGHHDQLIPWGILTGEPQLAAGGFTGESLRVGPPTYRLQRDVGDILAVINTPPKHMDILDGVTYDVNSTDADTYAAYENEQSQSTQMSLQVTRGWGFAAGMEVGMGNPTGTHFKTSMDTSYGANFSKTTDLFSMTVFGSEVKAIGDDILFYTGKNLQLWEYPVYKDNDQTPDGSIMVVFPQPFSGNTGAQKFYSSGNTTCDFWYAPEHQLNNVWSYAKDENQLVDFEPDRGILNTGDTWTVGANEGYFYTNWTDETVTQEDSSLNMSVDKMFESQIGGDMIRVQTGVNFIVQAQVSVEVYTPYVKGTLRSSYTSDVLSTHKVAGSDATTVHVNFGPIDPSGIYNYEVTPYLYWANYGYLVLDYLTSPLSSSFWDRYDKPDPAFVLPWADGHCSEKDLFSKDLIIDPPFASNGEVVTITATVHNFSNVGVDNVKVRFCLGDPTSGCVQIGGDQTIATLMPRGRVDVSTSWQASGTGLQRIYAIIDPQGQLSEMHDETTNSEMNNNVAFNYLQMGDSGYVDPGGAQYFDYQFLSYRHTEALTETVRVFLPTEATTETIRYELTPLPPTQVGGNMTTLQGFRLDAYLGGSQRDEPTMLSYDPAPAAIQIRYNEADIAGPEESLLLYTYDSDLDVWVDAACGEYLRYTEEDWMLVPVCKTGSFALLVPGSTIFLPVINR